jgi:hypothetical protein
MMCIVGSDTSGVGTTVLSLSAYKELYLWSYHETVWHFDIKERLDKVCTTPRNTSFAILATTLQILWTQQGTFRFHKRRDISSESEKNITFPSTLMHGVTCYNLKFITITVKNKIHQTKPARPDYQDQPVNIVHVNNHPNFRSSEMLHSVGSCLPIGCPEISVNNYKCALRNIKEGRRSHLYLCRSLKSLVNNQCLYWKSYETKACIFCVQRLRIK